MKLRTRRVHPVGAPMQMEAILAWIANVAVILIIPIRLGVMDASPLLFAACCLLCGIVLTLAEDWRYLRAFAFRPDVRGYMAARSVIIALCGIGPFMIGKAFA